MKKSNLLVKLFVAVALSLSAMPSHAAFGFNHISKLPHLPPTTPPVLRTGAQKAKTEVAIACNRRGGTLIGFALRGQNVSPGPGGSAILSTVVTAVCSR